MEIEEYPELNGVYIRDQRGHNTVGFQHAIVAAYKFDMMTFCVPATTRACTCLSVTSTNKKSNNHENLIYAILGFLSLIATLGLSFDPTPLALVFLALQCLYSLCVFSTRRTPLTTSPHAVYPYNGEGEAVNFLRKKGVHGKKSLHGADKEKSL